MSKTSSLEPVLEENLQWNLPRIKFLTQYLSALFAVATINGAQIANAFQGKACFQSTYHRIQRFFKEFVFDFSEIARLIVKMLPIEAPFVIAVDRTNWKFGKKNINILLLAIVSRHYAFPLCWTLLDKAGNSDTEQRISLLNRFISAFGVSAIDYILEIENL